MLEIIASLAMLSFIMIFAISTHIHNSNVLKERQLTEEIDRDLYNLMNEIKFNVKKDDLEELLSKQDLGLKFDYNFSKELINNDLKNLKKGNEINISLVEKKEHESVILIKAFIEKENFSVNIEKKFNKSWWMDYAKEQ